MVDADPRLRLAGTLGTVSSRSVELEQPLGVEGSPGNMLRARPVGDPGGRVCGTPAFA